MLIKAVCSKHPDHIVLILEGTTKYWYLDADSRELVPSTEQSERSTYIDLDESNLYCTADDPFNHDVHFEVVANGRI